MINVTLQLYKLTDMHSTEGLCFQQMWTEGEAKNKPQVGAFDFFFVYIMCEFGLLVKLQNRSGDIKNIRIHFLEATNISFTLLPLKMNRKYIVRIPYNVEN